MVLHPHTRYAIPLIDYTSYRYIPYNYTDSDTAPLATAQHAC